MEEYIAQTLDAFGIPHTEYRCSPEVEEQVIITIEFKPEIHYLDDYSYPQPKFIFQEEVAILKELTFVALPNPLEEVDFYPIRAMELVERKLSNGRLTEAPYWLYGLRSTEGTRELMWFSEDELISKREVLGQVNEEF